MIGVTGSDWGLRLRITHALAPVVLHNFMILLSQCTSWTCRRMHKKIANLLGKFSDLNPLIPKIRIINQQLLSEKDNLWPDLTWPDFDKFCGRASFFPLFSFFLLWNFCKGAGVVTPSKPPPPTNNFCLYPPPVLGCFWKDSLMTPLPTTPLQASFTATLPPHPPPLLPPPPPIKFWSYTRKV